MTFLVDGAVPAGLDVIGTSGVIDTSAAAYDTVGELVNYINSKGPYRAVCLVDPATLMANVLAKSAASCVGDGGLTFYLDTSVADTTYIWNCPITGDVFQNKSRRGIKLQKNHAVRNRLHFFQYLQNFSSACTLYVKTWAQGATSATTMLTITGVDNALTNVGNSSYPNQPWIEAPEGQILTLEIRSDTASGMTLQVTGSTVVRDGDYVVTEKQY